MRTLRLASVLAVVAALGVSPVAAQDTPDGLAGLLLRFFSPANPVVLAEPAVPGFSHAAHFVSQPNAQATLTQLNRSIATQISTFPLGSSSAGFTYTLTVNNVRDRASIPNVIAQNTQRTFSLDFVPLDITVITGSREPLGPASRIRWRSSRPR